MDFINNINIGPISGISALIVIAVCAIAVIAIIAVAIISAVKAKKESKDYDEDIAERNFFAQYGVTPEEVRLNQRLVPYRGRKDKNMIDYQGNDLGTELEELPTESEPEIEQAVEETHEPLQDEFSLEEGETINIDDIAPAPEEVINDSLNIEPETDTNGMDFLSADDLLGPQEPAPVEEAPVEPIPEEPIPEPVVEEPAPEPVQEPVVEEPVVEEPAPEPIPEPEPEVVPVPEEPVKTGVEKPETKKIVKKKPEDWSKYDGEYEGYYYDPEDACYYEGKPSAALAKKLEAKKAEIEAQNLKNGKKVVIKKVAPPFATLKTPKHARKDPAPYAGFDESKIYGKYVIENEDGEYYYSLYSNTGERLYESGNYSSLDFCKKAIDRFKSHAIVGTYTIEADGDKFCAVIKRKTYVHKGDGRSTFAEAEKHMNQIKDFAQTDIIREQ